MSYLSLPTERMAAEYDVVVIGSGYGGAIAASRLARTGRRVCVLERGEERQPGDFGESPTEGMADVQGDWPERRVGSRTALFDFRINPDISVLSGCGLGGTSLINANVAIPPDERVWDDPAWPAAIRADVEGGVADGVALATEMLRPTPYPDDWPTPGKMRAMEKSAEHMGAEFRRLPITVNFEDRVNHVGIEQPACNLCGNCAGGCNTGAKNTLVMNYLPDARNHGAEIFTRTSVRHVERRGSRWLVHFELLDGHQERFGAPSRFVAADVVVVASGSLGSTEILLRSREAGLPLSEKLGHGFTGNGDVLGFAYNADVPVGTVGIGSAPGVGPGPCITSVIDLRGTDRLDQGMVIEEGAIPSTLAPMLATSMFLTARALGRDTDSGLGDYVAEKYRELQGLVPGGSTGAIGHTQTFLVMSHDDAEGRIHLVDDRVRISWPEVGRQETFERVDRELLRATEALGGTYLKNPIWAERIGKSLITVHPLGGCTMGESAETGVVDERGRVFASRSGDEVHEGLYVCDGSIIPRSLGVNPFLTISALAERTAALIAKDRGWELPYDLPSRTPVPTGAQKVGVEFTEAMRGYFALRADADFGDGETDPSDEQARLEFVVTVRSDDLDSLLEKPSHRADLHGTVVAPALSAGPLTVSGGSFELLTRDPDDGRARRMNYRMPMRTQDGHGYLLVGHKVIRDDRGFDVWSDTTTLYVTVHEGVTEDGPVVGRGTLYIQPRDFARQLRTFRITGAGSIGRRIKAAAAFGRFFAGSLYDTYGGVVARRSVLDPEAEPRLRRELRAEAPEVHGLSTDDDVALRLHRYRGGDRGPALLVHGLGMASSVFTLDTIETNLVEYLTEAGFDTWLLDSRVSIDLDASGAGCTADDVAVHDIPAAVAKVREVAGADRIDIVAHGFGALTVLMSLVEGLDGVRSLLSSQSGLHLAVPRVARLKAGLHLPSVLKAFGKEFVEPRKAGARDWKSRVVDGGLRLLPVELEERCVSPVCRRITSMYGPLYEHDQLNRATHEALHEVFGIVNLEVFGHLSRMVRAGHAVSAGGDDYVRDLERLAIPMTFLHGGDNACFLPRGSEATAEALSGVNEPGLYRHEIVPDYGDTDCLIGKNAVRDIYPRILRHLTSVADGRFADPAPPRQED